MPKPTNEAREKKFLDDMMKRFDKAYKKEEKNRKLYVDDVKFSVGIGQWDERIASDRNAKHRPMLQFDQLSTPIRKMVGEMRMNRVHAKVRPMSSNADPEVAKIYQGIIYDIQYNSDADRIYDYAGEMIFRGGYGAWALRTRYTEDNPFLQEIYMERIPNPMTIFLDADCKDECYADAKEGWEVTKIPLDELMKQYPELDGEFIQAEMKNMTSSIGKEHWYMTGTGSSLITVADYYRIVEEKEEIVLLNDGRWFKKGEEKDAIKERDQQIAKQKEMQTVTDVIAASDPSAIPPPPQPPLERLEVVKSKEAKLPRVKHWKVCGSAILEPHEDEGGKVGIEEKLRGNPFPGSYIPLLLGKGPEINVDGEPVILSYIRFAKDPVRAYNYWVTAAAEAVALAGKQPIVATPEQTKGFEHMYETASVENYSLLPYHAVTGDNDQLIPTPKRLDAPNPPVAMFAEADRSKQAIEDALGMTPRDTMGQVGPERSEVAIVASQRPASVANSIFYDNLLRTIQHGCRVMMSMVPDVYDSERDVRIRNYDDSEYFTPINTTAKEAIKKMETNPDKYKGTDVSALKQQANVKGLGAKYNDLKAGKYGLIASYGPAYVTMRQESFKMLMAFMENDPKAKGLLGDLALRSSDFEYAEEAAARWKATLPPGVALPDPRGKDRKAQPNPLMIAKQSEVQVKAMKVQVEQKKVHVQEIKAMTELIKASEAAMETDAKVKQAVLGELYRMTSETHPADTMMGGQGDVGR